MDTTQIKQLFESLTNTFSENTTIKKVYGEPIETQGKTIIPVAQVSFGFGGGFGGGKGRKSNMEPATPNPSETGGDGGGMGGGLSAKPIGVIEVTPHHTRFIRFNIARYVAVGALLGLAIGSFTGRRTRRRHQYPPL